MACIYSCKYCNKDVCNVQICADCARASAEITANGGKATKKAILEKVRRTQSMNPRRKEPVF